MSNTFILPMDTTNDSLELIGGKGRSLAKMSNAGFDVPTGFHLNADAYRAFIAENDLQDQIVALAKPVLENNFASFERIKIFEFTIIGLDEIFPDNLILLINFPVSGLNI